MDENNFEDNCVRSKQEESKKGSLVSTRDYVKGSIGRLGWVWAQAEEPVMFFLPLALLN